MQMLKLETVKASGVEVVILLYYQTGFENWQIYMSVAPLFYSDSLNQTFKVFVKQLFAL